MTLARAGAFAIFVTAGVVGAIGLYLTWSLVATALHPITLREAAAEQKRTVLIEPLRTEPLHTEPPRTEPMPNVALAPPAGENANAPGPALSPAPKPAAPSVAAPNEAAPNEATAVAVPRKPAAPPAPIEVEVAEPKVVSVGSAAAGKASAASSSCISATATLRRTSSPANCAGVCRRATAAAVPAT